MKIGYLMQTGAANMLARPLSGPGHHVHQVCQELGALGHEVQLLLQWQGQLWRSTDLQHYTPVEVVRMERGPVKLLQRAIGRVQTTWSLPYAALFEAVRFAQACRQWLGDCDLFYERMGWMGYGGALAARWQKIPLVLEVNGDHLTELQTLGVMPHGIQKVVALQLMHWMTGQVAHVVTTGDGWRSRFLERWPLAPHQVSSVDNGSALVSLLRREQLRAFREPCPSEVIKLVYVGGFEAWHGIGVLLRAVAQARQQGASIALTLFGSGPEQETIERQIAEYGLEAAVTLAGFVDMQTLASHLADADIGLCPYCGRVEYTGLKLLDYKAAGLATIASGGQGQPALLRHGVTGLIVPPCNATALTQAIVALSSRHEERRAMGRQARQEAETSHHWRHTAQRLEVIFQQITTAYGKQVKSS